MIDDTKPKDSLDYHWTETSYDGKPGSWAPDILDHWHKYHDEHMRVLTGHITFRANGKQVTLSKHDGVLVIPRLHVHGFKFAEGEPTVLMEKTDPPGDFKEDFFSNAFDTVDGRPTFVSMMRAMYEGDTYVALPGGFKVVEEGWTMLVGSVVKWMYPRTRPAIPSVSMPAEGSGDN